MRTAYFSFIQGALYFFGLAENPAETINKSIFAKSDTERLVGDWHKIGNDIRKSYETCKTAIN